VPNDNAELRNTASLSPVADCAAPDRLPIVVHSHLRWDFVWQRPQQILSRLARHHRVLFIEEPLRGESGPTLRLSEPYPNIVRAVPVFPPGAETSVDEQCRVIQRELAAALGEHPLLAGRFECPIHWFYSPMVAPPFLDTFDAAAVVYDCMDELANFRFAPADLRERERILLARADVVFTGGYQLFRSRSQQHRNVHFYGCGVDVEHYGAARLPATRVPPELANLPRPILGYFGVIDERLDYDLIRHLAAAFERGSIAMIGPFAKIEPEALPRNANIHWLGQRAYSDLPAFVKAFDVCLMPFALNDATANINPTKTLEYMAAAKPIVSTAVPDVVRNFTPVVQVAQTYEEFAALAATMYEAPPQDVIERGLERAHGASWEAMVAAMREHMLAAVRAKRSTRAAHAA
jgi:glycosyltransferase involved in cell wall biosynthesis